MVYAFFDKGASVHPKYLTAWHTSRVKQPGPGLFLNAQDFAQYRTGLKMQKIARI